MGDIIETLHGISETRPERSASRFFTGSGNARIVNVSAIERVIAEGIAQHAGHTAHFSTTGVPQADMLARIFENAGLRINFDPQRYSRFMTDFFVRGGRLTGENFPGFFGRYLNEVHIPGTPAAPSIRRAALSEPSLAPSV